jgi:membrane fusion protein, macrolide-specific efflux system
MKMKNLLLILIVLAAAGGGAYWKLNAKNSAKRAQQYGTAKVERGNIEITVQSTASVRPQNRLEIKPPIAGRVDQVLVREGDEVKAGQIIAWISSTDRAALLDAARARGPEALAHWQEIYKATPIVAPLDGTIIARSVEPGQTVTSADTLLVMSDVLIVEAQVDETDLAQIALGQKVTVTLDAYPDQGFDAAVSHISYEAETVENVTIYKVEVLPTNMPEFVRSGMTAGVTFTTRAATNVLILPAETVHDENGGKVVWESDPQNSEGKLSRAISVGSTDGKNYEITGGLAEGDTVLTPKVQTADSETSQKTNPFMPFGPRGGAKRAK